MALFPTAWLRRAWAWLAQRLRTTSAGAETAAVVVPPLESETLPPDPGEVSALFRPLEGGRARVTVEAFEAEPRIGGQVRLRLRLTNVGRDQLAFGQVTLLWWGGAVREGAPLARQPALALPGTPPGGTAAFETRLPVPLAAEATVTVLLEPAGGNGIAWAAEGPLLLLERRVLAATATVPAA